MNVSELRQLAPETDVYELRPDLRYLIVKYSERLDTSEASQLVDMLRGSGIHAGIVITRKKGDIEVFEREAKQRSEGS